VEKEVEGAVAPSPAVEKEVVEEESDEDTEEVEELSAAESVPVPAKAERRRSVKPTEQPLAPIIAPAASFGGNNDSESDEDEEEADFVAAGQRESKVADNDVVVLTNEDLITVFGTVDRGATRGQLNPMLFGTLIRAVTNTNANLFAEMKMFSTFNTSGDGVIDLEEWLAGVKKIAGEPGGLKSSFYSGLVKYHQSSSVVL